MRHLALSLTTAVLAIVVVASCIPDFQFRPKRDAASGGGGAGGAASTASAGGSGSAGGAGGAMQDGGVPVPMVPCGVNQWHVECPAGEFCCYHEVYYDCDTCTLQGQCEGGPPCGGASDYRIRRCNGPEDCMAGNQCCEETTGDTACYPACSGPQVIVCASAADCPPAQPSCIEYNPPYTGYKHCAPS